jgi:hypothetical protein
MALFDFAFHDQAQKMKSEVDAVLQKEVWFRHNFGVYSIYCKVVCILRAKETPDCRSGPVDVFNRRL